MTSHLLVNGPTVMSFPSGRVLDRTGIAGEFNFGPPVTPQETMGLQLEPTRLPVDVLVIERVERPTEN